MVDIVSFISEFRTTFRILLILAMTFVVAKVLVHVVQLFLNRASKRLNVDPTQYTFLKHFLTAMIYIAGIAVAVYTIPSLRAVSVSIFASAGVLAVVLGFAAQQAFSNIISGIFIVIFKPYKVGDRIKLKTDLSGVVEDISLRHTVIRNFENKRFLIPNSVMSNEIIENSTFGDEKICKYIEFGISYDSDVKLAKKIIQKQAENHPLLIDNRTSEEKKEKMPKVIVRVISYGDSSVNLRAWAWAANPADAFVLGCDLNESIKEEFDKKGIEIPFPYRTIVYKDTNKDREKHKK